MNHDQLYFSEFGESNKRSWVINDTAWLEHISTWKKRKAFGLEFPDDPRGLDFVGNVKSQTEKLGLHAVELNLYQGELFYWFSQSSWQPMHTWTRYHQYIVDDDYHVTHTILVIFSDLVDATTFKLLVA